MPNLPRCAFVGQTPGERLDQAVHALGRLEQDGAAVRTRVLLVERGDEGLVEQIRKQNTLWYRVRCHAGASVVAKRLYILRLYHTEALVSLPESTPSRIIRVRGTVERIGALVSRVEGVYEFEVQPLREYFAARHLYKTAPYSPPGRQCKGRRPERFEALARSFYWTNVTRFFCGFYAVGELAGLAACGKSR